MKYDLKATFDELDIRERSNSEGKDSMITWASLAILQETPIR